MIIPSYLSSAWTIALGGGSPCQDVFQVINKELGSNLITAYAGICMYCTLLRMASSLSSRQRVRQIPGLLQSVSLDQPWHHLR